jgi:hypothetical protein
MVAVITLRASPPLRGSIASDKKERERDRERGARGR